MKYKAAIFDLDGTTLYTLEDLALAINHVLKENGYPVHPIEKVRIFVGNGMRKLTERALPKGTDQETVDRLFSQLQLYYRGHCLDHTRPYDGIERALRMLKSNGIFLATVSNKVEPEVKKLCEQFFPGMFDVCIGDRPDKRVKPWPDGVEECLAKLGVHKNEAVYIGDTEVDRDTAVNSDTDFLAVSWGFRSKDALTEKNIENIADTPDEMADKILSGIL